MAKRTNNDLQNILIKLKIEEQEQTRGKNTKKKQEQTRGKNTKICK